jgi:hypothetical protein
MKSLPIFLLLFSLLFTVLPETLLAQPGGGGCDPQGPLDCNCAGTESNPACPIDGGVSFLIAAGLGIGARRAYQEKKKRPYQTAPDQKEFN